MGARSILHINGIVLACHRRAAKASDLLRRHQIFKVLAISLGSLCSVQVEIMNWQSEALLAVLMPPGSTRSCWFLLPPAAIFQCQLVLDAIGQPCLLCDAGLHWLLVSGALNVYCSCFKNDCSTHITQDKNPSRFIGSLEPTLRNKSQAGLQGCQGHVSVNRVCAAA